MPYTEIDLAYIAGVIDSDGYIGITVNTERRRKGNNSRTKSYYPTIRLTQTKIDAINLIRKYFEGSYLVIKSKKTNHRMLHGWSACSLKRSKIFLEAIYPYLRLKKEQAKIVIDYCNMRLKILEKSGSKRSYTGIESKIWETVKKLNQTGDIYAIQNQTN
jgi:hypothetical protein